MEATIDSSSWLLRRYSPRLARAIREDAGLSQAELGSRLNVTRSAVSRWESGDRRPQGDVGVAYVLELRRLQERALTPD